MKETRNRKILLIRPRNFLSINNYPPLSLILIGTSLENAGYDVEIFNASNYDNYLDDIKKRLSEDVILVGITVLTTEVADAIKISKYIKQITSIPIVWGGWHATLFPEQIAHSGFVDYVIPGEGDSAIVTLAEQVNNKNKPPAKIIFSQIYLNIDKLPLPNYSLVREMDDFISRPLADKFQESLAYPIRWLPYQSSRGCPGECNFCINVVTDNQCYRAKSAEKVVDELETLAKRYGVNHFKIIDDNFFVLKERVKKICELIIAKRLKFTWDGECRVDYFRDDFIDNNLLKLLKISGLAQLVLGIESGSEKTLAYLNKGIEIKDADRAIKDLNRYGIISDCSFIVGIPGETEADIRKTADFINEHRKFDTFICGVQTYRPYPKSKIALQLIKDGKLKEPDNLEEWAQERNVSLYTYVDAYRPWIQDYKFSMKISYYHSLASGVWLYQHQLDNIFDKMINRFFQRIAYFRTKYYFFLFPLDRKIYSYFQIRIYRRIERMEKERIFAFRGQK